MSTTWSAERWETCWEQETVNLGMMQYVVYAVHSDCSTGCMLYWVYAVLVVWCTGCMLYWVYAVLGVCCTRCMLYSVVTLDHGLER